MSPTISTFLFEAVNFLLLAALLGRLFFQPVRKALETRRERLAGQEREADERLAEAHRLLGAADQRRRALDAELDALRKSARQAADREAQRLLSEAQQRIAQQQRAAREELAHRELAEVTRVSGSVAAAAGVVVEKLLAEIEAPPLETALLEAAHRQLAALPPGPLAPIRVESASELEPPERVRFVSALATPQGEPEFHVKPELIAGVRIATQQGLIDASVAGLARFAERELRDRLREQWQSEVPANASSG